LYIKRNEPEGLVHRESTTARSLTSILLHSEVHVLSRTADCTISLSPKQIKGEEIFIRRNANHTPTCIHRHLHSSAPTDYRTQKFPPHSKSNFICEERKYLKYPLSICLYCSIVFFSIMECVVHSLQKPLLHICIDLSLINLFCACEFVSVCVCVWCWGLNPGPTMLGKCAVPQVPISFLSKKIREHEDNFKSVLVFWSLAASCVN
jgi:hypothetical protein